MTGQNGPTTRLLAVAVIAAAAALSGCGGHVSDIDAVPDIDAVSDPLTPEQSRAQVVAAATEIVATLSLPVLRTAFWRDSCSDGGQPPFRGHIRITYPRAGGYVQSEAQIADMIDRLTANGWSADPGFHSHSRAITKDGVTAVFQNQNASVTDRAIDVLGACRDITTASHLDDGAEWLTLP